MVDHTLTLPVLLLLITLTHSQIMSSENTENISTTDSVSIMAEVEKRPVLYMDTANQKKAADRKKAWEEAAECLGKPVVTVRGHYENRRSALLRRIKSKTQPVNELNDINAEYNDIKFLYTVLKVHMDNKAKRKTPSTTTTLTEASTNNDETPRIPRKTQSGECDYKHLYNFIF